MFEKTLMVFGLCMCFSAPIGAAEKPKAAEVKTVAANDSVLELGSQALTLPLLVADGHFVVAVNLYNSAGSKDPVTLELALDDPCIISLHEKQYGWMDLPVPGAGVKAAQGILSFEEGVKYGVSSADFGIMSETGEVEVQKALTTNAAAALQERKLVGKIGLGFLRRFRVTLDFHARQLQLVPVAEGEAPEAPAGDIVAGFEFLGGRLVLPLHTDSGTPNYLVLGSSTYEARVLASYMTTPDRALVLESTPALNLSLGFAVRTVAEFPGKKADLVGVAAKLGTDFLDAYRVVIDWKSSKLALTQQRATAPAQDHRAFFSAEATATPSAYQAFLKAYPQSFYAREAAGRLMQLRFEQADVSSDDLLAAQRWVAETAQPERRTEVCLPIVEAIAEKFSQPDYCIAAGKLALEYSRAATHIQDIYRIHRLIGMAYYKGGDMAMAWRHLMSASFVKIERDGDHAFQTAFYLGCVYEKQGRLGRAYSRYKAALAVQEKEWVPPFDLKKEAEDALVRLRGKIPAEQLKELDEL